MSQDSSWLPFILRKQTAAPRAPQTLQQALGLPDFTQSGYRPPEAQVPFAAPPEEEATSPQVQLRIPYSLTQPFTATGMQGYTPAQIAAITRRVESSGNYGAHSNASSASGAYQNTDGNWNGFMGYATAALAPPWVQDLNFQQGLGQKYRQYGGDLFKIIASHYYPAYANVPAKWDQPIPIPAYTTRSGKHVAAHYSQPVADYISSFVNKSRDPALVLAYEQYRKQR